MYQLVQWMDFVSLKVFTLLTQSCSSGSHFCAFHRSPCGSLLAGGGKARVLCSLYLWYRPLKLWEGVTQSRGSSANLGLSAPQVLGLNVFYMTECVNLTQMATLGFWCWHSASGDSARSRQSPWSRPSAWFALKPLFALYMPQRDPFQPVSVHRATLLQLLWSKATWLKQSAVDAVHCFVYMIKNTGRCLLSEVA